MSQFLIGGGWSFWCAIISPNMQSSICCFSLDAPLPSFPHRQHFQNDCKLTCLVFHCHFFSDSHFFFYYTFPYWPHLLVSYFWSVTTSPVWLRSVVAFDWSWFWIMDNKYCCLLWTRERRIFLTTVISKIQCMCMYEFLDWMACGLQFVGYSVILSN